MNSRIEHSIDKTLLVISDLPEIERDEWEFDNRMIDENIIPMIIFPDSHFDNSCISFEYDISGLDTFSHYVINAGIDYTNLKFLLESVEKAKQTLKDFLLSENGLIMYPDNIYYSEEKMELCFIYIPGYKNGFLESVKSLAEFMLEKVDYNDEHITETVYKMYDEIINGRYEFEKHLSNICRMRNMDIFSQKKEEVGEEQDLVNPSFDDNTDIDDLKDNEWNIKLCVTAVSIIIALCVSVFIAFSRRIRTLFMGKGLISIIAVMVSLILAMIIMKAADFFEQKRHRKRIEIIKRMTEKDLES